MYFAQEKDAAALFGQVGDGPAALLKLLLSNQFLFARGFLTQSFVVDGIFEVVSELMAF
jgi:hypothetical protein